MDRQLQVGKRANFNWKRWLQNGLLAVAAAFVLAVIGSRWSELRAYHWQLNFGWLALSMLIMAAAWLVEVGVWRALVQMLGGDALPYRSALRIWFLTLLVRYVPGNVWQPVSVALHGEKRGLRAEAMLASVAMYQAVSVLAALPICAVYVLQHRVTGAPFTNSQSLVGLLLGCLLIPLALLLVRRSPESCGLAGDSEGVNLGSQEALPSAERTLTEALRSPLFWVFATGSALYGLVASGIGLFNESILRERGFSATDYHRALAVTALTGLAGNFLGAWLAVRIGPPRLMAAAMGVLAIGLMALPHLQSQFGLMILVKKEF